MKRIPFLNVSFLLALFFLLAAEGTQGQTVDDLTRKLERLGAYPDLIVINGKISTMDERLTEVEAMAVRDTRIVALGSNDEIRFLAGQNTEVLDVKGRRVLPGLIDSHTHPNLWGVEHWLGAEGDASAERYNDPQLKISLASGNSPAEVLRSLERVVRQKTRELGPGKWILVKVFGGKSIPESREIATPLFASRNAAGPIDTNFLDTLAPDNPVTLYATEAIGPTANSTMAKQEMIRLLGFEATGIFARTAVPFDILLNGRWEEMADLLKREILECLSAHGITAFGDRYDRSPSIIKAYNLLYQRGELHARYGFYPEGGANTTSKFADRALSPIIIRLSNQEAGDFRGIGNDYMWNAGIANEGWEWGPQGQGGIGTCTAAKPNPNNPVELFMACSDPRATDYEQYEGYQAVQAGLENGQRIGYLHAYSDGTLDALFHMIEEAIAKGTLTLEQVRALRISTEHNPMIRPDQVEKFAKYNIMPGFNGYQVQGDIKGGAFLKAYGEQYMNWMVPVKSLVDAGVHVVFNTDAHLHKGPVEFKDMDYPPQWDGNIWAFMEFFVTRVMPHDGVTYNKLEAVDKVTLMKAATIWGAEQLLNEKNIGSLEAGKLADFIVIDKDYFAIPEDQIHTIKNLMTGLGGEIVFRSPDF